MAANATAFNLGTYQRAERKLLLTVVEWKVGTNVKREILGRRTEDSSIEYNADIAQTTDIRGINYADINKTQPQQSFDPYTILGGSELGVLLNKLRRENALTEFNQFSVYIITAYLGTSGAYEAERHDGCTIAINSLGGDAFVNMPIDVYLSNDSFDQNGKSTGKPAIGTVDKLTDDFAFSADTVG